MARERREEQSERQERARRSEVLLLTPDGCERERGDRSIVRCGEIDARPLLPFFSCSSPSSHSFAHFIPPTNKNKQVLTKDEPSLWPSLSPASQAAVRSGLLAAVRAEPTRYVTRKVCDTVSELAGATIEASAWDELLPFVFQCAQGGGGGGGGASGAGGASTSGDGGAAAAARASGDGSNGNPDGTSDATRLVEAGLLIFSALAHYLAGPLLPYLGTLHGVLASCLSSPHPDVSIAAVRAVVAFVQSPLSQQDRDGLSSLVPGALAAVGAALNAGDEVAAREGIELLMEVAEDHPRFLRRSLPELVDAMLQVASADPLDPATRQLAAELVLTLCEARSRAPGMMRKLPAAVARLFEVLLTFLLDVDDDAGWMRADTDAHLGDGDGELFEVGQECLDRLALAMGGSAVAPLASAALPRLLGDAGDWRKRHAALVCLAQIAEGCSKVMGAQLPSLVDFCLAGVQDPHPRVRWAACQALGQMCTDLGPQLQATQGDRVLPALLAAMRDDRHQSGTGPAPRVQAHAAAALVNFTENAEQENVDPHLDELVTTLLGLLRSGPRLVTEAALTALASVADAAKEAFARHYDEVMPLLRAALAQPVGGGDGGSGGGSGGSGGGSGSSALLRAKALECVSLVGMAVGRDRFREDAHAVMGLLQEVAVKQQQAQQAAAQAAAAAGGAGDAAAAAAAAAASAPFTDDDPTASYALQAGARLCKCLGQEFLPYLGTVMPPLLAAAQLKPDVHVTDADDEGGEGGNGGNASGDGGDENDDDDIETIFVGDRKIQIKTSVLEDKATACHMICCYADELKEGFYPYVEQVTGIMVPLLKFYFHEGVRAAAAQAMPELLRSASSAAAKGTHAGADQAYVARMASFLWPPLLDAIGKEPDTEVLLTSLEAAREVIEIAAADNALSAADALLAAEKVKTVLEASAGRREDRAARAAHEDFDDDEAEALEAEGEEEEELLDAAAGVVGALLAAYGDAAMPAVDAVMPLIAPLLQPNAPAVNGGNSKTKAAKAKAAVTQGERRVAVCLVDDVVEHSPLGAARYGPQAVPLLLECVRSSETSAPLRQCASYGLGIVGEKRPELLLASGLGPAVAAALLEAASRPLPSEAAAAGRAPTDEDDDEDDAQASRDNAVSALGKLLDAPAEALAATGAAGALPAAAVDGNAIAAAFLARLPLRSDLAEARTSAARLVRLVESSDARVLGVGNAGLPAVVRALAGVVGAAGRAGGAGAASAEPETVARAAALLKQMQGALPPAVMSAATQGLRPAEMAALTAALQQ